MDVDGFIHDHTLVDYSTKEYNWDIIMYLFLCVCVCFLKALLLASEIG